MSFIMTYTKTRTNPADPKSEEIHIEDIAHALSMMCRANGHFKRFFSVAQHSMNCALEAAARGYSQKVQLACLLHDASEAYLSDITRPVKEELPQYRVLEARLQGMIYEKYIADELTQEEHSQIRQVDDAQLYYEFENLMEERIFDQKPVLTRHPDFASQDFNTVERHFISLFQSLTGVETGPLFLGIDGCKGGWMTVSLSPEGFRVEKHADIAQVCRCYAGAEVILIDIPIGLPQNRKEAEERPDRLLRKFLKGKGSSVFNVPFKQIVYAKTLEEAWEKSHELDARMNRMSMGICPAIKHVDEFLQQHPEWKNRLMESHPEYCFALLNGGTPIMEKKVTAGGEDARIKLLTQYYPAAPQVVHAALESGLSKNMINDVVDALCLAVMAKLIHEKGPKTIPGIPVNDSTGLKMQIVIADID